MLAPIAAVAVENETDVARHGVAPDLRQQTLFVEQVKRRQCYLTDPPHQGYPKMTPARGTRL